MDPKKLSVEQGKEFLKQLGIPQRDIDLMTEKWVVDAAVEVLLRFPLMPGEDPSARCVSNKKCQPSAGRLTASQGHKEQEKRKSNNQVLREKDQRPTDMRQMAHHYVHQRPPRLPVVQNRQKLQKGPVEQVNPPRAEEDIKVKCKNCGAFGHLASSKRCPMKCWDGALAPQALGSNKNENLEPRRPQDFQTPGSFKTDSGKAPGQRQEEQKKKAPAQRPPGRPQQKPQGAWSEPEDWGAHLRRPTRPLPVQTNTKPSVGGPVRTADTRSSCPPRPLIRAPEVRACEPAGSRGTDLPYEDPKSSRRDRPLIPRSTAGWPERSSRDVPPSARKTLAPGPVRHPQAQARQPRADSEPRPQPVPGTRGQSSKVGVRAQGKRSPQAPRPTCHKPPKKARFSFY